MAWSNYDVNTTTGDDPADFAQVTKDRTDALAIHHLSGAQPTAFTNGWLWFDSTSATAYVLTYGQNGGTAFLIGYDSANSRHKVQAAVDFNGKAIINHILQRLSTAGVPAASAANEGREVWDEDKEQSVEIGTLKRWYRARCNMDGTTVAVIPCLLHVNGVGTPATVSAASEFGGWLINTASEELAIVARQRIPVGWPADRDLTLNVFAGLGQVETAGDLLDVDGVWVSCTPGTHGLDKTETGFAAIAPAITGVTQYHIEKLALVVDHDDVTNTVATGDLFRATINHNTAGQVGSVIVVAAELEVPIFDIGVLS